MELGNFLSQERIKPTNTNRSFCLPKWSGGVWGRSAASGKDRVIKILLNTFIRISL